MSGTYIFIFYNILHCLSRICVGILKVWVPRQLFTLTLHLLSFLGTISQGNATISICYVGAYKHIFILFVKMIFYPYVCYFIYIEYVCTNIIGSLYCPRYSVTVAGRRSYKREWACRRMVWSCKCASKHTLLIFVRGR